MMLIMILNGSSKNLPDQTDRYFLKFTRAKRGSKRERTIFPSLIRPLQ